MAITYQDVEQIFNRIDGSGGLTDAMKSDLSELKNSMKLISEERDILSTYKAKYDEAIDEQAKSSDEIRQWKEKYTDLSKKYSERYGQAQDPIKDEPEKTDEYALHTKNNPTTITELFS